MFTIYEVCVKYTWFRPIPVGDRESSAYSLPSSTAPSLRRVQAWRAAGKGGVWLKLPINLSSHVPIATSLGFQFHHAEPEYVMLTTWLQDRPSPLPPSASHQVGVGVLVLNGRGEILVVKERKGPAAKLDIWKVPTGLLDAAEDFSVAAEREVKEETVRFAFLFVRVHRVRLCNPPLQNFEHFTHIVGPFSSQGCRPSYSRISSRREGPQWL